MTGLRPFWVLCFLAPALAFAGGNAFRTLVVVNTNSADSVELGAYYAAKHGIPDHQICSVGLATNLATLTSVQFRNWIRNPIYDHLAAEDLADQIDFVVLCQDFPTRIDDVEGIPAALFYGFQNAPGYNEGGIGCNLPEYTSNDYFRAERAFRAADGWNGTNGFVAFHLIASNLPTAKLVADRGAAAQSTFPPSAVYLYTLGSAGRSVREQLYANVQFAFTALPGLSIPCTIASYYAVLSGKTNAVGYQDGYGNIPVLARTNNAWVAGAYADHLTSCGGMLPDPCYGQSTVLDWMDIGATASYGTVAEPCNYLEKFPDPLLAFWYARGFTIGEAYAMAVAAPYQGLFAGDPLAAPFAAPPVVSNLSHAPDQIVTGTVPVQVAAVARSNGAPAARIDFYLDGRFQTNLAAVAPTPGNVLSVAVAGHTNSAEVATNQTLADAVAALAEEINGDTNAIVLARAHGDRLELAYENFDRAGDHAPVSAFAATGSASVLTLGVGLAGTNLYPSVYPARKKFFLQAHTNGVASSIANAGDVVTLTITLTNGVAVTNVLVASAGERITNLFERLRLALATNTVLMATNGVRFNYIANGLGNVISDATLFARKPGPEGAGILIDYVVSPVTTNYGLITNNDFSAFMQDWPDDLRARANVLFHVRPSNGVLAATAELDTTALADGLHVLDFVVQ
ncbi:MAG: TIGR03790 family protein, partial [Kiritimatiellia bacterium]